MFEEIERSGCWKRIEKICKGWSKDEKYFIETNEGVRQLLRVSDIDRYEEKKKEFGILARFAGLGFPMSLPVEFGTCGGGSRVYMLLTWLDGVDLESALPALPEQQQYRLGQEAGSILKKLHTLKVDPEDLPAETKKAKKLSQLLRYEASQVRMEGDETALRFVKENLDQIWQEAPVYLHGEVHSSLRRLPFEA